MENATHGSEFYIYCKDSNKGGEPMVYWYIPYVVYTAYPPGAQKISAPLAAKSDRTALPDSPSPFPPVQTTRFHQSARTMVTMMKQAEVLVGKIAESDAFASELMMSAQKSDQKKVDELVATAGINATVETKYTPDGIRLHIQHTGEEGVCCEMLLNLHW